MISASGWHFSTFSLTLYTYGGCTFQKHVYQIIINQFWRFYVQE
jgi:hypothetical protein